MRKIIYRGQRIDNKEWIQGNLFVPEKLVKGCFVCPETNYADFLSFYENGDDLENFRNAGSALGRFIPVDPKTVGIIAPLIDKNGKQSYEGDIVKYDSEEGVITAVIEYKTEDAENSLWIAGLAYRPINIVDFEDDEPTEFVIIGNIHDNQELLTQV